MTDERTENDQRRQNKENPGRVLQLNAAEDTRQVFR